MADCPTCEYHKQRAQIWRDEVYRLGGHPLPEREPVLEKTEQEPVAYISNKRQRLNIELKPQTFVEIPTVTDWEMPLYMKPQQRTWVGLTDEDDIDWEEGDNLRDLVKAIETKLKEKNT